MAELDPLSRLEALYQQTLDGLDAVRRVGEILSETFDEREICQRAVQIFVEYLPFENCSILLLNSQRTLLRLQAAGGKADEQLDDQTRSAFNRNLEIKVGEGIAGEVVTTGNPVLITNAGRNPRFKPLPSPIPIRSLLCLPLHSKDAIIGVINLSHPEIEEISIDQEKTLEVLSRMVGQCITISRLNAELISEKLQHSERLITLGQLSASVAHEVNNPLTNILLRAQKLQRAKGISEKDLGMATEIQEESERIATILTSVLDFSRVKRSSSRKSADVHTSLQRTLSLTTPLFGEKRSLEVMTDFADDLPAAAADPYDLEQVFTNLVTNAIQAMPGKKGGMLHISTQLTRLESDGLENDGVGSDETGGGETGSGEVGGRSDAHIEIHFRDNGCGISEDEMESIFEPFYTTRGDDGGTGLGLAICRRIMRNHGGELSVISKVDEGTTFTVTLPAVSSAPAAS